jgi:hypothetical protein
MTLPADLERRLCLLETINPDGIAHGMTASVAADCRWAAGMIRKHIQIAAGAAAEADPACCLAACRAISVLWGGFIDAGMTRFASPVKIGGFADLAIHDDKEENL